MHNLYGDASTDQADGGFDADGVFANKVNYLKLLINFLHLKSKADGWLNKLKSAYQIIQRAKIEKEKGLKVQLDLSDLNQLIHEDDIHKNPSFDTVKPELLLEVF